MYRKHEHGTVEVVGKLEMNIPPVGTVFNVINGKWETRPVFSRSKEQSEQYWERTMLPKGFNQQVKAEEERRKIDPSYFDVELEEFRKQEWDRRLNGFWFMNDGEATYITGGHYYYLCYYYIGAEGDGYPQYWDSDRKWWYFCEYCDQDPNCWGFIYLVKRRAGKTQKAGAAMLEYCTCLMNRNGGIQSKTADDAKNVVYMQSIVNAFKRQPAFFKPLFDYSAGTAPKKQLAFETASVRSREPTVVSDYDDQLNSFIFWTSSKETALDGTKLHRYIGDEVFKTENVKVQERHAVNKFCCTDHNGNPLGLMIYTSTCEEIKGAIQDYLAMWKDSDQTQKDPETGQTVSGLYSLFIPSDELMNRDKFGFCDKERNRARILSKRRAVEGNRMKLNSLVRKEPLTVEEAFRMAVRTCLFNSVKLTDRLDFLNFAPEDLLFQVGDFKWVDNVKFGKVKFVPNKNGLFKVKAGCLLEEERANQVDHVGGKYIPRNGHKFVIGVDPFDHYSLEVSDEKQKSDGAFYLKCKFDADHADWADAPLVEYCTRRDKPSEFYEDVLLCAWYYGSPVLFESQKQGIRHWFDDNHLSKFLMWLPGAKAPGIPSSEATKQAMAEYMEQYVEEHTDKINFALLIHDAIEFEITKTRKYDRMMAFGWTLVGSDRIKLKERSTGLQDMSTLFRKRKVQGI